MTAPREPRVLVLAAHWLGDTFWALQIIPFLKHAMPGCEIHAAVRADLVWLGELWVDERRVHGLRGRWSDRLREGWPRPWDIAREALSLRKRIGRVDLAIDLTNSLASALLTRSLAPARAVGTSERLLLARTQDARRPAAEFRDHLAMRPWWMIAPLFRDRPEWPAPSQQRAPRIPDRFVGARVTAAACESEVQLFPGAGWTQKRWPLERFVQLAGLLQPDHRVRLLFSRRERDLQREAEERIAAGRPAAARPVCRQAHDRELLDAISRARLVVANDSGPAHLAAAMGVRTLALYGPTNPEICGPLGPSVGILRVPCEKRPEGTRHHCRPNPLDECERPCLESLSVDDVLSALRARNWI